tara:strand:+ start:388 stop:672 length:285 start_codon:yes stop_codon:yes gene_type:complete
LTGTLKGPRNSGGLFLALLLKLGKHSLWIDRLQNLLHNHEFMLGSSVAEQVTVNQFLISRKASEQASSSKPCLILVQNMQKKRLKRIYQLKTLE